MNMFIATGNLKANPICRLTKKGSPVANFSIAVSNSNNNHNNNSVSWFKVVAFEKSAKYVYNKLKKGDKIFVSGIIRDNVWRDKANNLREEKEIKVSEIFLIKKSLHHLKLEKTSQQTNEKSAI